MPSALVSVATLVGAAAFGGIALAAGPLHHHDAVGPTAGDMSTANPTSSCQTVAGQAPHVDVFPLTGITLRIRVSDSTGNQLRVSFDFRQRGAHHPLATAVSTPVRSGDVSSVTVLAGIALTDGVTYQWSVRVRELDAQGQPTNPPQSSPTCFLVQDGTPPAAPVVTSTDYPTDQFTGGAGISGVFVFGPGDPTDTSLAEYLYGLDQQSPANVVPVDGDLTVSVELTPATSGPQDLFVRARDTAGNLSPVVDYHFFVNDTSDPGGGTSTPVGTWAFEETSGTTAADSSGQGHLLTLGPGATFTADGHSGGGLALDGVTGSAGTVGPVISTDESFTVAAWVKLSRADVPATIISQDGVNTSGFTLQYVPDDGGEWVFAIQPADTVDGPALNPAVKFAIDTVGAWVQVAGIYDATSNQLEIRVVDSFGVGAGFGTRDTPWNATGPLRIGVDKTLDATGNPVYRNNFPGVIDDVNVFQAALTETQLQQLSAM